MSYFLQMRIGLRTSGAWSRYSTVQALKPKSWGFCSGKYGIWWLPGFFLGRKTYCLLMKALVTSIYETRSTTFVSAHNGTGSTTTWHCDIEYTKWSNAIMLYITVLPYILIGIQNFLLKVMHFEIHGPLQRFVFTARLWIRNALYG